MDQDVNEADVAVVEDLLDEVATRIWQFEENGIQDFQGTYEEFLAKNA